MTTIPVMVQYVVTMEYKWGLIIKNLRENQHLTQEELALKSGGLTREWIKAAETENRPKTPSLEQIEQLAKGLNKDSSDLKRLIYNIPDSLPAPKFSKEDIIAQLNELSEVIEIPILGYVNAGIPAPAEQIDLGTFPVPKTELRAVVKMERLIGLKVNGNSLIGDEIKDEDIVVVDPDAGIVEGKIYILETEEGFVARHLHKENGAIVLTSSNGAYSKLTPEQLVVKGRVILAGKFRNY